MDCRHLSIFGKIFHCLRSQKELSEEKADSCEEERLGQREIGLANSLRGIGTGSQNSYWEQLKAVNLPVLLITGELDTKFVNISREMEKQFPYCPS